MGSPPDKITPNEALTQSSFRCRRPTADLGERTSVPKFTLKAFDQRSIGGEMKLPDFRLINQLAILFVSKWDFQMGFWAAQKDPGSNPTAGNTQFFNSFSETLGASQMLN